MVGGMKDGETSEDEPSQLQEDIRSQDIIELKAAMGFLTKGQELIKNGKVAVVLHTGATPLKNLGLPSRKNPL